VDIREAGYHHCDDDRPDELRMEGIQIVREEERP